MKEKEIHLLFKRMLVGVLVLLLFAIGILLAIGARKYEKNKNLSWQEGEMGDITEEYAPGEPVEIKENIVDAYGLEYAYTPIPSMGIALYVPVDWEFSGDGRYIYVSAPDNSDLKYTEIAICTNNLEDRDFYSLNSVRGPAEYVKNSLKYHTHSMDLNISLVDGDIMEKVYDYSSKVYFSRDNGIYREYVEKPNDAVVYQEGDRFIGYRCSPDVTFIDPNNAFTHTSPYTIFYFCRKGNSDQSVFLSTTGPRNYELHLEEIASTMAYGISEYVADNGDYYRSFMDVNMERKILNKMYYYYKSEEDSAIKDGAASFCNKVSSDPKSLAYGSTFSGVFANGKKELDEALMYAIWRQDDGSEEGINRIQSGQIERPKFKKVTEESVVVANRESMKIEWEADAEYISSGRAYFQPCLPRRYTSYVIPFENSVYIYTISYQNSQKYGAQRFLENAMTMCSFQ